MKNWQKLRALRQVRLCSIRSEGGEVRSRSLIELRGNLGPYGLIDRNMIILDSS